MAFGQFWFFFGFLLLTDILCVRGIKTQPQSFDLVITSASRKSERDGHDVTEYDGQYVTGLTYTVNFTASSRPEVKWAYGFDFYFNYTFIPQESTRFEYSDGAGSVSVSLSCERQALPPSCMYRMRLFIGDFSTQFFAIDMHWHQMVPSDTQQLHTQYSRLYGSGYDVAYTPGESFEMMISTPIATISRLNCHEGCRPFFDFFMPESDKNDRYHYVTNRTYNDSMTFTTVTFDTKDIQLGGYITVSTRYDYDWNDFQMTNTVVDKIEELVTVSVHDEKDPGPFPANYKDVRVMDVWLIERDSISCEKGRDCTVECLADANYIHSLDFFKMEADGSRTRLPSLQPSWPHAPHTSTIRANVFVDDNFDFSQTFSCQVTSEDGTTGETTFSLEEETYG